MTVRHLALLVLALGACVAGRSPHGGGGNADGGTSKSGNTDPNVDGDGDGYTANQGDCDDSTPLIGPNSVEVANNGIDDNCDGLIDNVSPCDTGIVGQKTADAMAKALGICDTKFLTGAKFVGPSSPDGRNTVAALGVMTALEGAAMAFISTGNATTSASYNPQPGTSLPGPGGSNTYPNPYKTLPQPPANGCGMGVPDEVNDYTELELDLTVPYNANSFSFQSQFFSAEYPEYVCTMFNDRFLVIVDDGSGQPQQIEFDQNMNPVSVNNGFFTICKNGTTPQTKHCTQPVSAISGTGYDKTDAFGGSEPVGGSTGWLTTTAPVTPGDHIKVRFIIFDEGDSILDSAALIDNFKWDTGVVQGPVTVP